MQYELVEFFGHFRYFRTPVRHILNYLSVLKVDSAGRNRSGKITIRGRSSNRIFRRSLRIDTSRIFFFSVPGVVKKLNFLSFGKFYDFIVYDNGYISLILAVEGVADGDIVYNTSLVGFFNFGSVVPLSILFPGCFFNGVAFSNSFKNLFSASPGSFSKLLKLSAFGEQPKAVVELPSREKRLVDARQVVTIGKLSSLHFLKNLPRKAGNRRLHGIRPSVRGVAMNPIDHPHGGGQGRTSGGRPSVTPWGIYTKGKNTSTRKRRRTSRFYF